MDVGRRTCSSWESTIEQKGGLQYAVTGLLGFFQFLLDCVILGLERKDGAKALGDQIQPSHCLVRDKDNEFHQHKIAEHSDLVFVIETRDDSFKQIPGVDACNGSFHEGIQGLVSALRWQLVGSPSQGAIVSNVPCEPQDHRQPCA